MATQSERDRLVFEMMLECKSQPQREASLHLVCEVWDRRVPLEHRNALLVALLRSYQEKERESWCLAVLRLSCYPILTSVSRITKVSFDAATSAFDQAVEKFDFEKDSQRPKSRLNTRAIAYARGEEYEAAKLQTAAKRAAAESELHPVEDVLSGLVVDLLDGITEERAREILEYFVASGDYQILPQDIEPILKKLYHADEVPTSTERKRKSRAVQRLSKGHSFGPSSLRREGSPPKKKKGK